MTPETDPEPMPPTGARPDTSTPGRIVAHRGASRVAPENTLAAFRIAAEQGATWLEFDVSLLGDRTPVVIHDDTLERTTSGKGSLKRLTRDDLEGIDAGRWFSGRFAGEPLPTLAQTLDLIAELGLSANLEMKPNDRGDAEPLARTVAVALASRPWARSRILVSSFDIPALEALRHLVPDQPIAVLYEDPPADWPVVLKRLAASSLHIWYEHLTPALAARARAEGVHLRVYTINEPKLMEPFRGAGLAGVITDHPPLFLDDPEWAVWGAGAGES